MWSILRAHPIIITKYNVQILKVQLYYLYLKLQERFHHIHSTFQKRQRLFVFLSQFNTYSGLFFGVWAPDGGPVQLEAMGLISISKINV